LVDCRGVVIGINSAKIADPDFEGMGFAIPADTVRAFLASALPAVFVP
jgi:serine protease Do